MEQDNSYATKLAWFLATCPDEAIRNGSESVRLAEEALYVNVDVVFVLDALAAGYAEVGRFEDAIETQKQVLSIINDNDPGFEKYLARLKNYQAHKPWREK